MLKLFFKTLISDFQYVVMALREDNLGCDLGDFIYFKEIR